MKNLANIDKDEKIFCQVEREFELRQAERKNKINLGKEEMDRWRQPQKMKIVLSRKYR